MMFSATFGARARETAKSYMNDQRYVITVGRVGSSHSNIIQYVSLSLLMRMAAGQTFEHVLVYLDLIVAASSRRDLEW